MAILAPIAFIGVLEYARGVFVPILGIRHGSLFLSGVVMFAAVLFYGALWTRITKKQERLSRRNRELIALRSASLDITSELSLEKVLQKIVDQACHLIGTRYGALAVYEKSGAIVNFVTSGINEDLAQKIGALPTGKGLLAGVLKEGQNLRIADIEHHSRSCGFPPNHPPMHSLLAVPVVCNSPFRGNLYLAEKGDGTKFSQEEEETLSRFATQAAIAVDNAHLHAQVGYLAVAEERLRLAHEMHDGQAQVLAYVNTKAQAVDEFLRSNRTEEARKHLAELSGAAREVYTDVREGILGLRTIVDAENGLTGAVRSHVGQWQDQSGILVHLEMDDFPRFPPGVELQLLRILQEALSNVRKHSAAEQAKVEMKPYHKGLRMVVEDGGKGFDPAGLGRDRSSMPRFGLATMRERAEAIGAEIQIQSAPGMGTKIELKYSRAHEG